jgi:hypothetical protein
MAAKEMFDYLSEATADYTATEFIIKPQIALVENSSKNQKIHEADDGSIVVTNFSTVPRFTVKLQWNGISISDSGTIFDFFNDTLKGNGMARTFYWPHYSEGTGYHTYTVRFFSDLSRVYTTEISPSHRRISEVTLKVEGFKPSE